MRSSVHHARRAVASHSGEWDRVGHGARGPVRGPGRRVGHRKATWASWSWIATSSSRLRAARCWRGWASLARSAPWGARWRRCCRRRGRSSSPRASPPWTRAAQRCGCAGGPDDVAHAVDLVPLGEAGGALLLVRPAATTEAAAPAAPDGDAAESFRHAFDHAPIGIAVAAPDGRWLQVNAALCSLVGRERDDLLTTDLQSLTHPDDLAHDLELIAQVVRGEAATCQLETRYVRGDGRWVHVLVSISLVPDAQGQPRHFVRAGAGRDRAAPGGRAARAPRAARRAHGPAEPRAAGGAAAPQPRAAGAQRAPGRGAVPRPRPLQERQRLARPPRRRPAARARWRGGCAARCGRATPSGASAATSSSCCATTSTSRPSARRWPTASPTRCASRSRWAATRSR